MISHRTHPGPGSETDTLILALGNPLRGDDGVGVAILETLVCEGALPEGITLLDGGIAGLETVLLMQGYQRVIIIDAAEIGQVPGVWMRFAPSKAVLQPRNADLQGTLHNAGLTEALTLGEALGILPPEIVIYGVQPQEVGWSPELSAPVQQAVPLICAAILEEIQIDL